MQSLPRPLLLTNMIMRRPVLHKSRMCCVTHSVHIAVDCFWCLFVCLHVHLWCTGLARWKEICKLLSGVQSVHVVASHRSGALWEYFQWIRILLAFCNVSIWRKPGCCLSSSQMWRALLKMVDHSDCDVFLEVWCTPCCNILSIIILFCLEDGLPQLKPWLDSLRAPSNSRAFASKSDCMFAMGGLCFWCKFVWDGAQL